MRKRAADKGYDSSLVTDNDLIMAPTCTVSNFWRHGTLAVYCNRMNSVGHGLEIGLAVLSRVKDLFLDVVYCTACPDDQSMPPIF
jgi:hypothetical protein